MLSPLDQVQIGCLAQDCRWDGYKQQRRHLSWLEICLQGYLVANLRRWVAIPLYAQESMSSLLPKSTKNLLIHGQGVTSCWLSTKKIQPRQSLFYGSHRKTKWRNSRIRFLAGVQYFTKFVNERYFCCCWWNRLNLHDATGVHGMRRWINRHMVFRGEQPLGENNHKTIKWKSHRHKEYYA